MYIDHIAIWTEDLEREKDFFLKYFECTVNEKYINSTRNFSSYFITFREGARIELMKQPDLQPGMTGIYGLTHLAINVGDRESVDRLTELFEKDGIEVVSRPRITGDGYYESVILDPEKNRIEIISL